MLIKNEILKLSQEIKDNKLSLAFDRLDKMIVFKSAYPNCCSNCSGHGFKGSTGCKKDSHQSWNTRLKDFKTFLNDHNKGLINKDYVLPFSVFKSGNAKLKFMNYSTIPVVNCPGAGACAKDGYCYSLKSLMRPNASLSWLQNQILEDNYFFLIEREFKSHINKHYKKNIKEGSIIDFRLYNDGDFSSLNNMILWFNLLKKYPNVKAYGYSKSLHLIK